MMRPGPKPLIGGIVSVVGVVPEYNADIVENGPVKVVKVDVSIRMVPNVPPLAGAKVIVVGGPLYPPYIVV